MSGLESATILGAVAIVVAGVGVIIRYVVKAQVDGLTRRVERLERSK